MVLLSFDVEEFDLPCDYGVSYNPISDGISVSGFGVKQILAILKEEKIKATFFCTTNFAEGAPDLILEILNDGHEIASHGCNHRITNLQDIGESKWKLEKLTGRKILGYRQPRMGSIDLNELIKNGYTYNASLNPTYVPKRYNNFSSPKLPFVKNGLVNIPASVTPFFRFPLFWLSFHNLPIHLYLYLCKLVLKKHKVFSVYFHPWEFFPLYEHPEWKIPFFITRNTGEEMHSRFRRLVKELKRNKEEFCTYSYYSNSLE